MTLLKYTSKEGSTEQTEFRLISKCIRFRWYPACLSRKGTKAVPGSSSPSLPVLLLLPPRWKRPRSRIARRNAIPSPMTGAAGSRLIITASPKNIPTEQASLTGRAKQAYAQGMCLFLYGLFWAKGAASGFFLR